jgi:deoxyribonuclease-4
VIADYALRGLYMKPTIRYGLKLWSSNESMIEPAAALIKLKVFHYIELMPVPGSSIEPFLSYTIPWFIHTASDRFGMNIGDPTNKKKNLALVKESIDWADAIKAEGIILHPGYGSFESALEFLTSLDDNRVYIENMPFLGLNNDRMVGYDRDQINILLCDRFKFCFDINHAIKASMSLKRDYCEFLQEFVNLEPMLYHISDGTIENEKDEHLSIGGGNYDFKKILRCIQFKNEPSITLETPKDPNSLELDIQNRNTLHALLGDKR